MPVLAQNLETSKRKLSHAQMTLAGLLGIGFRTYVHYETGKRNAAVSVLMKIVKVGDIALDRLLTTTLTLKSLETLDTEATPTKPRKMGIISGELKERRAMFVS